MIAVMRELYSRFLTLKSLEVGPDVTTSKIVKLKPVIKNEFPNILLKKNFLTFLFATVSSTLN